LTTLAAPLFEIQESLLRKSSTGVDPVLVLTRRKGEIVVVGGDIRVKVLEVRQRQVRIGVTAPPSATIRAAAAKTK
jgi:hypothetical protein